ncbi:ankyrin repeat and LEM domain-containing protein 1 isoform X2 [Microcebus murinus]|uniref:ankyrin repeat and LEM domain-containing protein 1 isoform X2 n=1 Tax=Microcebus murinus TaxID=30608 RepID=UPI003F6B79C4
MGAEAGLARRLRAALRAEEPRAVQELLRRGADPNLVLADGAAAIHLAAGARSPRGLCCLQVLLCGGGDPNARSAEALTPLHVAAAWGCRRGLELLLSRGADPTLRDQDGLRPLDLAVRQGHAHCARVLRELDARTPTRTGAETQEPEPEPGSASGPRDGTLDPAALLTRLGGGDGSHAGLEAGAGSPSLPAALGVADKDRSSASPPGRWDCSSDESFVTAVEGSGAEDLAPDTAPCAGSLPQTRRGPGVRPAQRLPRSPGAPLGCGEAGLTAHLQALTLASRDATSVPSLPCAPLGDTDPARSPPRTPRPAPSDFHVQTDAQTPLDSEVAALWLTEDEEASSTGPDFSGHSPELAEALRTGRIPHAQADEDALAQQFARPDPARKWREGVVKSSFTYLLLDPRETQDLPARAFSLTPAECLQTFVRAIFYVGKGTRARPYVHLWEALGQHGRPGKQACPKVRRILDIWASGRGVISLHCFQHSVAVEAYTREACLVDALGIQTLTNQKQGHCYGVAAGWPPARRRRLGVRLLHRALLLFLAEGERELRPQDIQARG